MEKKTIVLLTYGTSREHQHGDCVDALTTSLGVEILQTRESRQIDISRSLLATTALGLGADVSVFIDSDILFEPIDVLSLADAARETKGVVGAPYSQRKMGGALVGSLPAGERDIVFYEGGSLIESPGTLGMGFTAIHSSVLERIAKLPEYVTRDTHEGPLTPFFQKIVVNNYWLHEDASFCHIARVAGAGTFLDTRIRVKHLGLHAFSIEDCGRPSVDKKTVTVRVKG